MFCATCMQLTFCLIWLTQTVSFQPVCSSEKLIKVVRMLIKSFGNDWLSRRAHVCVEECFSVLKYCTRVHFKSFLWWASSVVQMSCGRSYTLRSEVSTGQCKITNDTFTSVCLPAVGEPENKSLLLCIQTAGKWSPLWRRATPTTQVQTEFY